MNDLINGRTPEEIKRWVDSRVRCDECTNNHEVGCEPEDRTKDCQMCIDTLALIERLESERDAALAKVPKWIKLTEDNRPPDGYYYVMVKKRGIWQRDLLRYNAGDDDWWKELSTHDEIVPGYLITHYVPLPEPPEEEPNV